MDKKTVTVTWLTGLTFDAALERHHLIMDSAPTPEESRGASPMLLLLAALAGCTAMDVAAILTKARQPFTALSVRAEGERAAEHPRRYTDITLVYEVHGQGLDRALVERAVSLSDQKYCSVTASLREPVRVTNRIELVDAPGPAEA
jgi:putative redox protein